MVYERWQLLYVNTRCGQNNHFHTTLRYSKWRIFYCSYPQYMQLMVLHVIQWILPTACKVLWPSSVCVLKPVLSKTNSEYELSSTSNGERIIAETSKCIALGTTSMIQETVVNQLSNDIHTFETKMLWLRTIIVIWKITECARALLILFHF